jgi:hypothetical protein
MALKTTALLCGAIALLASAAHGQSLSAEAAQTGGYSTTGNAAAATQLRIFGDAALGITFNLESAWAARSGNETDAFGAAYPYDGRMQVIEAYGERMFQRGGALVGVRAGRFRTPFGISSASDHAYSGFLRAPLIRYDNYFALSNNFLEHGASVIAGVPRLFVEATVGAPGDVGEAIRPAGIDRVIRVQGAYRSIIVGASHIATRPFQSPLFAHGTATFTGIDGRWMHDGVEIRGEWLSGRPFDGTRTRGGYVDLLVHRPGLGPLTMVIRAERLGYDAAPPFALYAHRYTAGGRIRLPASFSAQVNVLWQESVPAQGRSAVDVALTYVWRIDSKRKP